MIGSFVPTTVRSCGVFSQDLPGRGNKLWIKQASCRRRSSGRRKKSKRSSTSVLPMVISLVFFSLSVSYFSPAGFGNRKRPDFRWRLQEALKIECSRPETAPEPNKVLKLSDHQHRRIIKLRVAPARARALDNIDNSYQKWRKMERWSAKNFLSHQIPCPFVVNRFRSREELRFPNT